MSSSTTVLLLDQWKKKRGFDTDYQAAKALRTSTAVVSNWRRGENHMSVIFAEKIALDLGLDVLQVFAAIEADRADKTPDTQAIWRRYGKAMAMTLLVGFALPGSIGVRQSAAAVLPEKTVQIGENPTHYAKLSLAMGEAERPAEKASSLSAGFPPLSWRFADVLGENAR